MIEATTIQDPISFATTLRDDERAALGPAPRRGGDAATGTGSACSRWRTTRTTASVVVDENGGERFDVDFNGRELERIDAALEFTRKVLEAAGATQICWTGLASTHVQGRAGWATTPSGSAVDRNGRVARRRSACTSATARSIPRTLSGQPVADDHGARDQSPTPDADRTATRRARRGRRMSARSSASTTGRSSSIERPEPEPVGRARRRRPRRRRRRLRDRPARDRTG